MEIGNQAVDISGFSDLDDADRALLEKTIATYVGKISKEVRKIDEIKIRLKTIHERKKSEKYEIHAKIIHRGRVNASHVTDRNLLAAVDNALKKLLRNIEKP